MSDSIFALIGSPTIARDIADTLLGKAIGSGAFRVVYECRLDPTLVVKIEQGAQSFKNIREWEMWDEVEGAKNVAKWLAPCVSISPCGTVLVQKRAEKCDKTRYPKQVPAWFGDMKYDNFGLLNGKLVCFDYSSIPISAGLFTKRMKKADWWHDTDYHEKV